MSIRSKRDVTPRRCRVCGTVQWQFKGARSEPCPYAALHRDSGLGALDLLEFAPEPTADQVTGGRPKRSRPLRAERGAVRPLSKNADGGAA